MSSNEDHANPSANQSRLHHNRIKKREKRNIWSSREVRFFLTLIKEKKMEGLMDGKRLRTSEIFKTLVAPMAKKGFSRDLTQMIVKYKNLKAEYHKCVRHNAISDNDPFTFDFYEEMDEILGTRSMGQSQNESLGFESLILVPDVDKKDDVSDVDKKEDVLSIPLECNIEMFDNAPDFDGAVPGTSEEPGIKKIAASTNTPKSKKEIGSEDDAFIKALKELQQKDVDDHRAILDTCMKKQEEIFVKCTKLFLDGLKDIFEGHNGKKTKKNSSTLD